MNEFILFLTKVYSCIVSISFYKSVMFQKRLPSGLVNEIVNVYGVPTWISCIKAQDMQNDKYVLVIPGNPGPIGFYESFIESLYKTSDCSLTIYGISHAGLFFVELSIHISLPLQHIFIH